MLKNLFKPKWQHSNPDVRCAALNALDVTNPEQHRIVIDLASTDAAEQVRMAACQRLRKPVDVFAVLAAEKAAVNRAQMLVHLSRCLNESGTPPPDSQRVGWLDTLAADELASLFRHTTQQDWCAVLLQQITDNVVLVDIAVHAATAQWRQQAAERIHAEADLEALAKQAKNKDKSVYRIARDRLEAIRAEQKTRAGIEQQIQDLCQQAEQLARAVLEPLYDAKIEHLHKQWQRVATHSDSDSKARYQRAMELCRKRWQEAQQQQQAAAEQQSETEHQDQAAIAERMAACEQLAAGFQALCCKTAVTPEDLPALNALLKTQALRWQGAHEAAPAQADERKRFEQLYRNLEKALHGTQRYFDRAADLASLTQQAQTVDQQDQRALNDVLRKLQRLLRALDWPADLPAPPALNNAEQAIVHLQQLGAEHQAALGKQHESLDQILKALQAECRQGQLKQAQKLLREAQQAVQRLSDHQAGDYPRKVRELSQQVYEMRDWQGFVTQPKKLELCEAMEALVDQSIDPEALATKVKRLQDDWKALGGSEGDKALWDRFHAAAERAYEPCKAHFARIAELRAANLVQRQRMVEQLQIYLTGYDWAHADWKAVDQVYQLAKQEWRQYAPVERKAGDLIQAEFNALLEQLKARLDAESTRNRQQREVLIAQAEALLAAEDLGQAIQSVKQLQQSWKQVGLVARRDDQRLWKQFRNACDQIFARRDQQRETVQAERASKLNQARDVLAQMTQLLDDETLSVAQVSDSWHDHQQALQALEPLPRDQREEIQQQLRALEARLHSLQQQARAARLQTRLKRFADQLAALDAAAVAQSDAELPAVVADDLPANLAQALLQRVDVLQQALATGGESPDVAAADKLRDLCVQMEILAGLESPPEDQARRMALQLERLTAGLGQREASASQLSEQVIAVLIEWLQVTGADPALRSALTPRLMEGLRQAGGF